MIYHAAIYRLVEELEPADLPAVGQQLEEAVRRLHAAAKADWDDRAYDVSPTLRGLISSPHGLLFARSLPTIAFFFRICPYVQSYHVLIVMFSVYRSPEII